MRINVPADPPAGALDIGEIQLQTAPHSSPAQASRGEFQSECTALVQQADVAGAATGVADLAPDLTNPNKRDSQTGLSPNCALTGCTGAMTLAFAIAWRCGSASHTGQGFGSASRSSSAYSRGTWYLK